ncbi:sugar phosphate isomerase/epimerase [Allorhizobium sp. BGMRC 0089]|uniref:sugar phosphate isomerase/epimerase family protein n=1 Tax=Allorhizobium sonneratiae TaxID=2934936 RepID=UPI0020336B39|nr:sugar phosphate isomerase/epimerase [Allorhizobium sonneratiae]MCM2294032.1 sugar phosphate isomerase/epimerase [Allorhizobium sonneratiae]
MSISFQLYSARDFTPWTKVLDTLSSLGYAHVEGFGGVYADPAQFAADLAARGLSMPSGHFSIDMLENDFAKALEIARAFSMTKIYCPYLMPENRPTDLGGWRDFAARLARVNEKLKAEGYAFGWHNHDFELRPLADGSVPLAILLDAAPEIGWEADIAWVVRGGADPLDWVKRYGPRITAAHVKDIAPAGECADEDGWADVGHGVIDWKTITAALKSAGCDLFIMEHDKPKDAERFASRSIAAFKSF